MHAPQDLCFWGCQVPTWRARTYHKREMRRTRQQARRAPRLCVAVGEITRAALATNARETGAGCSGRMSSNT